MVTVASNTLASPAMVTGLVTRWPMRGLVTAMAGSRSAYSSRPTGQLKASPFALKAGVAAGCIRAGTADGSLPAVGQLLDLRLAERRVSW